jgi:hypothetical protein
MELISVVLILLAVVLNAVGDACNDSSRKVMGHTLNSLAILALLVFPLVTNASILKIIVYVLIRASIFDIFYNGVRCLHWAYMGKSSLWDRFFKKAPPMYMVFFRLILLVSAITIVLRYVV